MNGHGLQATWRELTGILRKGRFWLGFVCVMAVLTASGPFDTWDDFGTFGLTVYWTGVSAATFPAGAMIYRTLGRALQGLGMDGLLASLLGGLIAGPPVAFIVFLINTHIVGNDDGDLEGYVRLVFLCTPVAVALAGLQHLVMGLGQDSEVEDAPKGPALVARLSQGVRGAVLSLRAQDHYVEVVTRAGRELLLMRFADAIEAVDGVDGRQVHRSWWVARDAVVSHARSGHQMVLKLVDGREVSVGRARQKAVAEWLAGG